LTPETSDVSSLIHPLVKLSRHNVTQVWHSEAHRLYKSNHLSSCFLFTYNLPSDNYGKSPFLMGIHQLFNYGPWLPLRKVFAHLESRGLLDCPPRI
jgi:hypothetical protein